MDNQDLQEMNPEAVRTWEAAIPLVEKVWGEIFQTADKILLVHLKFGFKEFADKISPSIDDIVLSLKAIESILDSLHAVLDYPEQRMVSNAKQQILWVQSLAEALQHNDKPRYDEAVDKLSKQAVI